VTTKTMPPTRRLLDEAYLHEFLMWANTKGFAICQWQPTPNGEYLADVTELAIDALPVQFVNERETAHGPLCE